jgi:hypothetical protein
MKRNNQPSVPQAKKVKKKAGKGFVWDEWGRYATKFFGEVYRGEHKGKTSVSIFRLLDLPYNKYSKYKWNRHYNGIKSRVLRYKTDAMGLENETFRMLVFGVAAGQSQPRPTETCSSY